MPSSDYLSLSISSITHNDVLVAFNKIKNSFTAGPDQIPGFVIHDCKNIFVQPLLAIFNVAFTTGTFAKNWKTSKIFKSGNNAEIDKYRPVSIINNFSKVFEVVLYSFIYPHVRKYISPQQHGFVDGRSTITNLACFSQFLTEAIDNGSQVDVIYTDFAKAFDRLDHLMLLSKLQVYGLCGNIFNLLRSYLSDRSQYVFYNGHSSHIYDVTSGVPQGANLGPLLFILFVNDLPTIFKSQSLIYADDAKIYHIIRTTEDAHQLQSDMNQRTLLSLENRKKSSKTKRKNRKSPNKLS